MEITGLASVLDEILDSLCAYYPSPVESKRFKTEIENKLDGYDFDRLFVILESYGYAEQYATHGGYEINYIISKTGFAFITLGGYTKQKEAQDNNIEAVDIAKKALKISGEIKIELESNSKSGKWNIVITGIAATAAVLALFLPPCNSRTAVNDKAQRNSQNADTLNKYNQKQTFIRPDLTIKKGN